ncbi:interferon alpha-inducible protein 27-like protein 2B isoform X1 [Marmota marmota marmota]|uniref:interferon alpha-inducible protein 27-like protein 2B isoform X1 n=2 Tax=Marmota marmota marmota TaxID=9994 RepID=UPI0020927051|nr:interferon alpha-inducible protein 27-like protein 2B isoform X1 [Marmota marmota marmota]
MERVNKVWSNRSFLLGSMALTSASMLASSLATQLTSAVTMAEAGGAACGTLLAGLSSQGAMLVSQASLAPVASTVGSFLSGFSAVTSAAAPIGGATMISKAVLAPVASAVGPLLGALNVGSVAAAPIGVKAAAVMTGGEPSYRLCEASGWAQGAGSPSPGSTPMQLLSPTVLTVGAVPVVLGAIGFTGTGIAASSLAAKMMSIAAIANGGGVSAGSLVATLQSVGAAGLSLSSKMALGSAGSAIMARIVGL